MCKTAAEKKNWSNKTEGDGVYRKAYLVVFIECCCFRWMFASKIFIEWHLFMNSVVNSIDFNDIKQKMEQFYWTCYSWDERRFSEKTKKEIQRKYKNIRRRDSSLVDKQSIITFNVVWNRFSFVLGCDSFHKTKTNSANAISRVINIWNIIHEWHLFDNFLLHHQFSVGFFFFTVFLSFEFKLALK